MVGDLNVRCEMFSRIWKGRVQGHSGSDNPEPQPSFDIKRETGNGGVRLLPTLTWLSPLAWYLKTQVDNKSGVFGQSAGFIELKNLKGVLGVFIRRLRLGGRVASTWPGGWGEWPSLITHFPFFLLFDYKKKKNLLWLLPGMLRFSVGYPAQQILFFFWELAFILENRVWPPFTHFALTLTPYIWLLLPHLPLHLPRASCLAVIRGRLRFLAQRRSLRDNELHLIVSLSGYGSGDHLWEENGQPRVPAYVRMGEIILRSQRLIHFQNRRFDGWQKVFMAVLKQSS